MSPYASIKKTPKPGLFINSTHLITHDPRLRKQQGLCLCFQNHILSSSREHPVSLHSRRDGRDGRGNCFFQIVLGAPNLPSWCSHLLKVMPLNTVCIGD